MNPTIEHPREAGTAVPAIRWPALFRRAASLFAKACSFPAVLATGILFVVCWPIGYRILDPDTWWHLRLGEQIWSRGSLPVADELSFTAYAHPWVANQWLGEITIYAAYRWAGYQGLLLWLLVVGGGLLVLLYAYCAVSSGNAKTAVVGGLIGWFFATIGFAVRPQTLGYLFLVVQLFVLFLARERDRRWLWVLPPLFALWINCHSTYVFGLAVLAIFVASSHLEFRLGLLVAEPWDPRSRRLLAQMFPLSLLATFVNPIGAELIAYPVVFLFRRPAISSFVDEWKNLDFHDPRGLGVLLILGLIVLLVIIKKPEIRLEELLLLGWASAMAFQHMRILFFFGIIAAPIVCRLIADGWDRYDPRRDRRWINAFILVAAILVMVYRRAIETFAC